MDWRRAWTQRDTRHFRNSEVKESSPRHWTYFYSRIMRAWRKQATDGEIKGGNEMTWRISISLTKIQRWQFSGLSAVSENKKVQKRSQYSNLFFFFHCYKKVLRKKTILWAQNKNLRQHRISEGIPSFSCVNQETTTFYLHLQHRKWTPSTGKKYHFRYGHTWSN